MVCLTSVFNGRGFWRGWVDFFCDGYTYVCNLQPRQPASENITRRSEIRRLPSVYSPDGDPKPPGVVFIDSNESFEMFSHAKRNSRYTAIKGKGLPQLPQEKGGIWI
jgi:hypothetical protein